MRIASQRQDPVDGAQDHHGEGEPFIPRRRGLVKRLFPPKRGERPPSNAPLALRPARRARAASPGARLDGVRGWLRPLIVLALVLLAMGAFTGSLAWLLDTPRPGPGAPHAARLYQTLCATCHGADGRGSWRAKLFLIRPGNLSDRARMSQESDDYLSQIIKQGGAPIGRPGMPAFGLQLKNEDIEALVRYIRTLPDRP